MLTAGKYPGLQLWTDVMFNTIINKMYDIAVLEAALSVQRTYVQTAVTLAKAKMPFVSAQHHTSSTCSIAWTV